MINIKSLYLAMVLSVVGIAPVSAYYYGPDLSSMMMTGFTYANTASELTKDVYYQKGSSKKSAKKSTAKSTAPKQSSQSAKSIAINPSSADVRRVAKQLASNWPKEHQATMTDAFVKLYNLVRKDGMSKTLEGAVAYYVVCSYVAYTGQLVSDDTEYKVVAQYENYVKENPNALSGLSAKDRTDAYLEMVMLSAQMAYIVANDPSNQGVKQAGKRNLEQLFGISASRIVMNESGVSIN